MKSVSATKRVCRAGIIAALYAALTYAFMPFAFGPFQLRPAEALCILPLFFPEAVPALVVGCALSNLTSPFFFYDIAFGSLATLIAALGSYTVGVFVKNRTLKFLLGGAFPVLVNAFVIPLIIVFLCDGAGSQTPAAAYWTFFLSFLITQSVWVYGLGGGVYALFSRNERK